MRQFPAYKLSDIKTESAELLWLVNVEARGRPEPEGPEGDYYQLDD